MKLKYNLGEKIWRMDSNKPKEFEITGIRIGKTNGGFPTIYYGTGEPQDCLGNVYIQIPEEEIYSSKEELLNSF